ncbi:diguanylate cyclase [Sulfurospirillum diekertiae]|uniref:Diguanylate cyclase n=1 Tax=Sulfurospirillum diekertiae TaxID=1854492 RepID=A0A290HVI2_9BACT|nr:EAL domain-containing protein [Sulfurospirillum diekertiae]ATB69369.1 diguanylate cyclase [Sulfurospirillum diekertiae]
MATLQKNIWTIFYILLASALLFLGIVSYIQLNSIHQKYETDQINLVKLVSNATDSLFLTQEMMLNLLGNEIAREKDPNILDDLRALNPSVVSFGFTDVEGTYLYTSSNFDKSKRPNLRTEAVTRDSFDYTLTQKKMVLGRTYFIAGSGRWGIPIRKTAYDELEQPIGVMTAGIGIEGAFKIYTENLSLGDYNTVTLIRDRDHFVQFQSSNHEISKNLYEAPLPNHFLQTLFNDISQKYNISIEEMKQKSEIYTVETSSIEGRRIQIALKYEPRYELWILSEVDHSQIMYDFIQNLIIYGLIFIVIHMILFLLFKMVANAENKRRADLTFQATHDTLTQLPNRNYLQQYIQDWVYHGAPPFNLYYIDMDHFKNINDSFGHYFGDMVLIEFSKRLLSLVQKESVVIRQGGDEFIILSSYLIDDDTKLLSHIQNMTIELLKPYHIKQFNFVIGVSVGIAKYPEHGTTLDMLLRASDIAMYEAKKQRNSVHLFLPSMQEGYLNRVNVEQALHKALTNNELYMVYQPQVDKHGVIYGVEALIRWQSEELGLVPPDQFIPIAEASGLMPQLGHFIMSTTLKEMKALQMELGTSFQTSVNISIKQFMEIHFLEKLTKEIDRAKLASISLCLEITESLFIEDIDYILPLLQKIRGMGLHISMDDFGTGYSSLSILRKLPIDELKIDKSFVDTILNDITAEKMVQNIIMIGKNLDLYILAEGVETQEQEAMLKSLDCDRFQGYFYAKPLRYDALKEFFEQNHPHMSS